MTIIDLHHKYIFIHVPKTAGSAIRVGLGNGQFRRTKGFGLHVPLSQLPRAYQPLPAFAFVRNPWDRQLSYYTSMCRQVSKWYDVYELRRMGFKGWLLGDEMRVPGDDWHERGLQRRPLSAYVEGCTYVGKYENLKKDMGVISNKLRIKCPFLMPINTSRHLSYRMVYDAEMREAVAEWFAEDIRRWGYRYE